MSFDLNIYLENIDDSIIAEWIKELNKLDMICEIYPGFSFMNYSGFVPFKINIQRNTKKELMNCDYLTGFEIYINKFKLSENIESLKRTSLFGRLFSKKNADIYFASPDIDKKLKLCKKVITFNFGSFDTLEFRIALLSAAILSKLKNGLCYFPADNIWCNNDTIIDDMLNGTIDYENSLKSGQIKLHKFEKWL